MAVNLSPIGNDAPYVDSDGDPASGYLLYTYVAGSSTPASTYTTSAGDVANANPVVFNSAGYPASGGSVVEIWLTEGTAYKFIFKTGAGATIWTRDNISGIGDSSDASQDQWVSGATPTYISATSFSLVGDQTSTYHVGRRVKTTNSGGTVYSRISASAFGAVTTVTVVNDSGTLDSGLSAVSYGLLSATNPSTPLLTDDYPIVSGSADKTKLIRMEVDGLTTATTRVMTPPNQDSGIGLQLATQQATTSGTSIDFTSIPAWVKRITLMLSAVSTNGTDVIMVQLGDAGGIEASGYLNASQSSSSAACVAIAPVTTYQPISSPNNAADTINGVVVCTLIDAATFNWSIYSQVGNSGTRFYTSAGTKATSAILTQIRLSTSGGTNTFDAGTANALYE